MSTNLVTYIVAFVIAGAITVAVFVGEDRGWGAGMTFAVVGAVAVLVVTPTVIWMVRRKRRRLAGFARIAPTLGMQMVPDHAQALLSRPFRLFSMGTGREMESVAVGEVDGRSVWVADLTFWRESYNPSSSSKTRHDYEYTCAVFQLQASTGRLVVGREGFWSRIGRALGLDDVETGDPGFDRAFKITSSDAGLARAVLHPEMRAWLATLDERWGFELAGGHFLAFTHRLPLSGLGDVVEMGRAFLARVPPELVA